MSEELTPMNHRELWLKAIATGTVPEWLEPMTHEELWLKAIAQGSGGGSGGGGANNIVYVDYTYQETSSEKTFTLTKTAGELLSLLKSGKIVFIQVGPDEYRQLAGVHLFSTYYGFPYVEIQLFGQSELQYQKISYDFKYRANGSTDYPTFVMRTGGGGGND